MKTFIDIRSLDTKQMTGVPEYVRLLTEHILKEAPQDEYVFSPTVGDDGSRKLICFRKKGGIG